MAAVLFVIGGWLLVSNLIALVIALCFVALLRAAGGEWPGGLDGRPFAVLQIGLAGIVTCAISYLWTFW